jgi:hypothetical protein
MSTAPRLTIGLPVYNGEKYVAESLEAVYVREQAVSGRKATASL